MDTSAPIFGFNAARSEIVEAVVDRVTTGTKDPLIALNDAAYHEIKRYEGQRSKHAHEALSEWQRLARSLGRMTDGDRRAKLLELCKRYGWDVAGNFDPRVYNIATRLMPSIVTGLLAPRRLAELVQTPSKLLSLDSLEDKVLVHGPLEQIRAVARLGTAIYVPTHLSNMDSIVFGYALERAGLPPATYGAGKNLFTNPLLGYFMHNLGAYRVDRRIRHQLYKDVLKSYSSVLIERGYHSLFFPGGTRSRSGGVERRLKLGLVGSAIEAYARTLIARKERRVFFVPATINYLITLEAETLIADYLSEAGKGRFIIEDDESSRLGRVAAFVRKLLGMEGAVVIQMGEPIDPFGNRTDADGRSFDRRGREVDPASYVKTSDGEVVIDPVRDAQYTRELGEEICRSYAKNTIAMSTHVVAAACFAHLRKAAPAADIFTVLRQRGSVVVPRDELAHDVCVLRDQLLALEKAGEIVVSDFMRRASGGDIVERAITAFRGYHSSPVLDARKDGIALNDTNLLFYYQNRLAAHGLAWDVIAPPGAPKVAPRVELGAVGPGRVEGSVV